MHDSAGLKVHKKCRYRHQFFGMLSHAKLLAATKTGTVNEIRKMLGQEGISADEIVKMQAEWGVEECEVQLLSTHSRQ